jgi:hypothetical protein
MKYATHIQIHAYTYIYLLIHLCTHTHTHTRTSTDGRGASQIARLENDSFVDAHLPLHAGDGLVDGACGVVVGGIDGWYE